MAIPQDGRVIVPDYNPKEALQPQGLNSSTYVKPAIRDVGNGFAALAQALGGFASFATRKAREKEAEGKAEEAEAKAKAKRLWAAEYSLKGDVEQQEMIDSGKVPYEFGEVAGVIHGSSKANAFNRSLPSLMADYDPAVDGSKEDYVERKFQEVVVGLTPEENLGFDAGTRDSRGKVQDAFQGERDAEAQLQVQNDNVGYLRLGVDAMNAKGAPAPEVIKKVFDDADLDPELTKLLASQKNSVFYELAKEWAATGRPDLIRELVKYERKDVGAIADTIEWRDKFEELIDKADVKFNEDTLMKKTPELQGYKAQSSMGMFTLNDMEAAAAKNPSIGKTYFSGLYMASEHAKAEIATDALINAGSAAARRALDERDFANALDGDFDKTSTLDQVIPKYVKGPTGGAVLEDTKVTYEDRKKTLLANIKTYTDGLLAQGAPEEEVRAKEMTLYSNNNLVHPDWEAKFGAVAATSSMGTATKANTDEMQNTGELYRTLYGTKSALAKSHVGDSPANEMWLETYRMARAGANTQQESAVLAAKAVEDYNDGVRYRVSSLGGIPPIERATTQLQALYKGGIWPWSESNRKDAIGIRAGAATLKRAEFYMGTMKMSEADALKQAAKWMSETHTVIGNELVFAGYDGMPKDFKERVNTYFTDKFGEDAPSYSVMTVDSGHTFLIMDQNGMPAFEETREDRVGPTPKPLRFTVEELGVYTNAKRAKDLDDQTELDNKNRRTSTISSARRPVSATPADAEHLKAISALRATGSDRDLLIRTVAGEAFGEDEIGRAAVAHVILNRAMDGRWKDTIGKTATQANAEGIHQFSAWNHNGQQGNNLVMMDTHDPRYLAIGELVDKVLSGEITDPTGGAVYYVAPNSLKAPPAWWTKAKGERNGATITIGNHVFTGKGTKKKKADGSSDASDTIKSRSIGSLSRATQPVDLTRLKPDLKITMISLLQAWPEELKVNSGYRSPAVNKRAGGANQSAHMNGSAIDIDVTGWSLPKRKKFMQTASALGFGGIGVYTNAIHLDVASRRAWGPSYKIGSVPKWARGVIAEHLYNQIATH